MPILICMLAVVGLFATCGTAIILRDDDLLRSRAVVTGVVAVLSLTTAAFLYARWDRRPVASHLTDLRTSPFRQQIP
jgi:hypothetical protein